MQRVLGTPNRLPNVNVDKNVSSHKRSPHNSYLFVKSRPLDQIAIETAYNKMKPSIEAIEPITNNNTTIFFEAKPPFFYTGDARNTVIRMNMNKLLVREVMIRL